MPHVSPTARRWWGLIALALGVALIVVDITIVSVIIPPVIEDLGIDSSQVQWVQESYAIVFAALLLVVGRVADLRGARMVFIAGTVIFGLTSLLAGVAPNGEVLIIARFLQGIGAAMILPTTLSLLNRMFTGKARGQAFAVWGGTIGAATALGPVIGGWLAEHTTWRWAFGINIPLAILIIVLAVVFIDRSPQTSGRLDAPGAILSVVGLGLLAFGIVEGRTYGWVTIQQDFSVLGINWVSGPSPAFAALVVGSVVMAVFVWRQIVLSRGDHTQQPLMDTSLFSIASFRHGNIATVIIGLGEYGIIAVLPLWLQFTLDYTPLQSGAALVPVAIGSFVASGMSFPLAEKISPLIFVRIGLAVEVVGLAGLGFVAAFSSAGWLLVAFVLFSYGIGVGFATAQVTNVVLADVPEDDGGQSSAIQSTCRQLGSALGIAALTTVFFSTMQSKLGSLLTAAGLPADQVIDYAATVTASGGAAIESLAQNPATAAVADAARDAMTQGLAIGAYVAAGFLILGLVATFRIPNSIAIDDETSSAAACPS